jgi:hypothetical protein
MIAFPVSRWPVNETMALVTSSTSAWPVAAAPVTRLMTPGGTTSTGSPADRRQAPPIYSVAAPVGLAIVIVGAFLTWRVVGLVTEVASD